jgi:hypothetical protein
MGVIGPIGQIRPISRMRMAEHAVTAGIASAR